ncbi:MAG TPA: AI-2E family transporter [Thermodesulfobacteriota bacterium]|nr:AI-2E family transporter [Thermodesulfobacteriota bacterium]
MLRGLVAGRRAVVALLVLGVLYTVYLARSLLLPVFLALLLAAFLQPWVRRLSRFRIPDSVGAAIIVLVFVAVLGTAIYQFATPAVKWVDRGPLLLRKAEYNLLRLKESIKTAKQKTEQFEDIAKLGETKDEVVVKGPGLAERVFTQAWLTLVTAAVVLALVYFLLAQGRQTLLRLSHALQGEGQGKKLTNLLFKLQQDIASYLATIAIIYLVVGSLTAIALTLLGVPTPLLWGAVAVVLHFIPFLGPVITFLILCGVSLMTFDTSLRILLPPLIYFCLAGFEGYFATPMILGRRLTLNPIMVFGAILFWGWMWGILGVFLAVPILTSLKIICDEVEWLKPLGQVLSSDKAKEAPPTRRKGPR